MRMTTSVLCAGTVALALLALGLPAAQGQTSQGQASRVPSRVTAVVDDTRTVQRKGNVHPLARPEFDRGAVGDSQPMTRMLLLLERSDQQERDLRQLIDEQQTKGSANYHTWITPQQFGKQFGPSDADIQSVTDWLTRQGFEVTKVAAGRIAIEFSGTVAEVRNAFHTEMHKFSVNGEERVANVGEPSIPEALAPVVKGVVALHNFPHRSHLHNRGVYRLNRTSGEMKPLFTYGTPANFAMAPADFAKVYSIPSGATGTGETIAIVSDSNINAQDVIDFRTLFGLPQNFTQANNVLVNGPDPGLNGDEGEADLDVQWSGAVAPNAHILLVTSSNTQSNPTQITNGTDLSALYIVDNQPAVNGVPASILSESFGECESGLGASGNQFFNQLWEQAASEGITVVVSAGDSGSAGCDPTAQFPNFAVNGLAVSGMSSTPFNVAVGGTDFDASAQPVTPPNQYWGATNTATNGSALQYIPETTWNDSICAISFPSACNTVDSQGADVVAGSGGPSNCATFSGSNCSKGYAIPAYQVGVNKVFPKVRTQPDVSFFASNGQNGVAMIVCQADANPNGASCNLSSPFTDFTLVGGTSASTPAFAGIVALLNEHTGARQGNVNYGLYALAASDPNYGNGGCNSSLGATPKAGCVFNDVTKGNIAVACQKGSTSNVDGTTNWCAGSGTFGVTVVNGTSSAAYAAATGYDPATGLGSINVTNLLAKWSTFTRTGTTTTISNLSGGATSGSNFSATVIVTSASAGDVSLTALGSNDPNSVLASFGPFSLSSGSATVQTSLLPPGTAYVSAYYAGDATHAASSATPVKLAAPVAGAGFASQVQLNFVTFDSNGNPLPTTQAKTVSYGSDYILNVLVNNGTSCGFNYPNTKPSIPCPTGTVTLADSGKPLMDFPSGPTSSASNSSKVSNQGLVEDGAVQLTGGTHSIVATYSGDANYSGPAMSNTLSVTITPAQTTTSVASNLGVVSSGTQVILTAVVGSTSNSSQGPTGTVQFQNGSSNLGSPVTCTPNGASSSTNTGASCTAQLTTTIAALVPPGTRDPRPIAPWLPLSLAFASIVCFLLGLRWMPEKRRRAYACAGLLVFALLAVGIAGCGGGSGGGKTVTIKASYSGDTNYTSSSGSGTINVN